MSLPQRCLLEGVWDPLTGAGRWRDKSNKQPELGGCFPLKTSPSHGDCQALLITVNKKLLISMSSSLSERNNPKWVPLRTIVAVQSGLTPCEPMDCSMPGFPGLHYRPEFAQTHVHWVDDDAIQPFRTVWTFSPFSVRVNLKASTVGGWKPQRFGSQTGGSKSSLNTFWPNPPSMVEILLKYCKF